MGLAVTLPLKWLRDHHSNVIDSVHVEVQLTGATKHKNKYRLNLRNAAYLYGNIIKCT